MKSTKPRAPIAQPSTVSRRDFLYTLGIGACGASLASACGEPERSTDSAKSNASASGATSGEGPEVTDLRFGMIALTDCSPIVIAHEKGFFKKYGINSTREGRELGGHPRLSFERRHPSHAHAHRHADRLDDGSARFAEEADGHSVAAQSQRPGDHAEERARRAKSAQTPRPSSHSSIRPRRTASR